MRAIIYKTTNDGQQVIIAAARISPEGQVLLEGEDSVLKSLQSEGIRNYDDSTKPIVFPSDGEVFLKQLPLNFRNGYIMAEIVDE